mmetsp:Transcript_13236/g.35112  ORF Transcript_13236/g.35112 Transcript_13236/m.35112 type:complete len:364 (-) Transcript_13236:11-1102(-)
MSRQLLALDAVCGTCSKLSDLDALEARVRQLVDERISKTSWSLDGRLVKLERVGGNVAEVRAEALECEVCTSTAALAARAQEDAKAARKFAEVLAHKLAGVEAVVATFRRDHRAQVEAPKVETPSELANPPALQDLTARLEALEQIAVVQSSVEVLGGDDTGIREEFVQVQISDSLAKASGVGESSLETAFESAKMSDLVEQQLHEPLDKKLHGPVSQEAAEGTPGGKDKSSEEDGLGGDVEEQGFWPSAAMTYPLEESVWDASFLVGHRSLGAGGSIHVFVLLFLNCLTQGVFVYITGKMLATDSFTAEDLNGLRVWRRNVGQNAKYYDKLTFSSLTERICAQSPALLASHTMSRPISSSLT